MARDRAMLKADGTVSVSDFHVLIGALADVLSALTEEETENPTVVDWVVHTLKAGSATVISKGLPGTFLASHAIERVVDKYESLARNAHHGRIEEFSPPVQTAVRRLAGLLNGRITRISMSGGDGDGSGEWSISPQLNGDRADDSGTRVGIDLNRYARASITGQVVTLDDKRSVYFTLREARTGRLVRCYPNEAHRRKLGSYWAAGTWVIVEGTFSRYTDPPTMYAITDMVPIEDAPAGSWRDAVGCAPRGPGDDKVSAADAVRRVRDG